VLVFAADGAVAAGSVHGWFHTLARPPLVPQDRVFGLVWAALNVMAGVSAWLVWRRIDIGAHRKRRALRIWGWQLLANAAWPAAFFGLTSTGLGLGAVAVLWGSIAVTVRAFWPLHRGAALLLGPYLLWVGFAAYLNLGFWWLNRF
jgi:benzodiazapine receptor